MNSGNLYPSILENIHALYFYFPILFLFVLCSMQIPSHGCWIYSKSLVLLSQQPCAVTLLLTAHPTLLLTVLLLQSLFSHFKNFMGFCFPRFMNAISSLSRQRTLITKIFSVFLFPFLICILIFCLFVSKSCLTC